MQFEAFGTPDLTDWWTFLNNLKETYPLGYTEPDGRAQSPRST